MERQPRDLRRLLSDAARPRAPQRLRGRRVLLAGTGTSWHAAGHGAALLRRSGIEAWALAAPDLALEGPPPIRRATR